MRKKDHQRGVATAAWTATRATLEVTGVAGDSARLEVALEAAIAEAEGVPAGSTDALIALAVMGAIRDAILEATDRGL